MRTLSRLTPLLFAIFLVGTACQKTKVNGIASRTGDEVNPPQLDLESFEGCTIGELGWVRGNGVIVNQTDEVASYEVVVAFAGDGVRVDQATTWIRDLRAGERSEFQAGKLLGDRAPSVVDCEVILINRF